MNIIACQSDFIMTGVEMIEVDDTVIRFEDDRYHQFWHFDSEEEAEKAFTEVWKEINSSVHAGRNCFLEEKIIKERVIAGNYGDVKVIFEAIESEESKGEINGEIDRFPFGKCENCSYEFNSELVNEYNIKYCPNCGMKVKSEQKRK